MIATSSISKIQISRWMGWCLAVTKIDNNVHAVSANVVDCPTQLILWFFDWVNVTSDNIYPYSHNSEIFNIFAVLATRSAIADLVRMRAKLLKWSAFRPHFTFKVSFSPLWEKSCSEAVKKRREKCQSDWERGWGAASLGKWDYIILPPWWTTSHFCRKKCF